MGMATMSTMLVGQRTLQGLEPINIVSPFFNKKFGEKGFDPSHIVGRKVDPSKFAWFGAYSDSRFSWVDGIASVKKLIYRVFLRFVAHCFPLRFVAMGIISKINNRSSEAFTGSNSIRREKIQVIVRGE